METRFEFNGAGGGLFKATALGFVLTMITCMVYMPWLIVDMVKYIYDNTVIKRPGRPDITLAFAGRGGELAGIMLLGILLTSLTFGIYTPWYMVKMLNFFYGNLTARSADGTTYQLRFELTGSEMFKETVVPMLLTMVTCGVYSWFIAKHQKLVMDGIKIVENGNGVGTMHFAGSGGELFGVLITGVVLTMLTAGIYAPWMSVKMMRYIAANTQVFYGPNVYEGDFLGSGGGLFWIMVKMYFLGAITLGIYSAWSTAEVQRFQTNNFLFRLRRQSP